MAKIQSVLSAGEMKELLSSEQIHKNVWIQDENQRKQCYRDMISGGNRITLLQMVGSLYRYRSEQIAAGRKFHQCDENFLRDAEKLLSSEIALVLEISPDEARDYLRDSLKSAS